MRRPKKLIGWMLLAWLAVGREYLAGEEVKKIGLVPAYKYEEKSGRLVPAFQQQVWQQILKSGLCYDVCVVKEEDLKDAGRLKVYSGIIVISSRNVLTREGLRNLKEFVSQGGKIIREMAAVSYIDNNGDGWLNKDEQDNQSAEMVNSFWRELAGCEIISKHYNLVKAIKFSPEFSELTRGLPEKFTEGDLLVSGEAKPYLNTVYYRLFQAKAVAQCEIVHIPDYDLNKEGKKLEGEFPVIALNRSGEGYCLSLGLNLARAIASRHAGRIFRCFLDNMIMWLAGGKG